MDLLTIAIFVGQWALIELSKRLPTVGKWIQDNAPAVVAIWTTIGTVLHSLFPGVTPAHAGIVDSLARDSTFVATAIPVYVASGFLGWIGNFVGLIQTDNILRKIIWHWIGGHLLKIEAAKEPTKRSP